MKFIYRLIFAIIDSLRPMLGAPFTCIYWQESCRVYAKRILLEKPWYISPIYIVLRILSCNPMGALFLYFRSRSQNH